MPILREFDLDLPNDTSNRFKFRNQTRCVTSLYERIFEKYKTDKCWKVLVECVDVVNYEKYRNLLGAYCIQVQFKLDDFFHLDSYGKKRKSLALLKEGVHRLIFQTGWDSEVFERAFDSVVELDYLNVWQWKKSILSPSNVFRASIVCEHDVEEFNIIALVCDKKGEELMRKVIISESPNEFSYSEYLGKLMWDSESRLILYGKNENTKCIIDVSL